MMRSKEVVLTDRRTKNLTVWYRRDSWIYIENGQ
jgi:hypothetical protein